MPPRSAPLKRNAGVPPPEAPVRFRSGDFTADLEYDEDGFVVRYPGLAIRTYPAAR